MGNGDGDGDGDGAIEIDLVNGVNGVKETTTYKFL